MICSDRRCPTCTPWQRAEAGYDVTTADVHDAIDRALAGQQDPAARFTPWRPPVLAPRSVRVRRIEPHRTPSRPVPTSRRPVRVRVTP